ncbi:MAG: aromatic ring-hydroxylating dioxygenase subunit alpha [Gammaproteobacteria bacterium]|nr:aromatic ring-hydroxylating dioxygenase subunit alpha [Gammaproteobacteria bacterium]
MNPSFETFWNRDTPVKPGLPSFVYTDEAFRQVENQTIFAGHWVFAGFAHRLEKVGDVEPVTVAGKPFFIVRSDEGTISAFHNVCRHRCLKLVETAKSCGRLIQCPYHRWAYDLRGRLKSAPYFSGLSRTAPEGFSMEGNDLVPVRCRTWHDWVFVNVDGQAGDFGEFIRPLENQLKGVDLSKIVPVATLDFGPLETNWKTLMENFIEPYHVQFVHQTTTSQPLVDHYTIIDGHCLGSACDIDESRDVDTSGTLAVTSRFLTLFPNFVMGTYAPDQIGVHLNIPEGAGRTRQQRVIYLHESHNMPAAHIEQIRSLWYDVHKEDHEMCERLQQGRVSEVAADGGSLSPHWEDSVRRFQEMVVESVSRLHN